MKNDDCPLCAAGLPKSYMVPAKVDGKNVFLKLSESAYKKLQTLTVKIGQTYTVPNQGMSITPKTVKVTVIWRDDFDVYYRVGNVGIVKQTPIERFLEIINQ